MPKKWFGNYEIKAAKVAVRRQRAEDKKIRLWKYVIVNRNGRRCGFYAGTKLPVVLRGDNVTTTEIPCP